MGWTELLLVIAVVGGIIAVLYPTFRGAASEAREGAGAAGARQGPEAERQARRRQLEERRRAVIESLEEIEADHAAGNLAESDFEEMRRRYEREATAVLRELESLGRPEKPRAPARKKAAAASSSSKSSRGVSAVVGWVAAGVAFGALAMIALSGSVGPRGDGVMTGSVPSPGESQPQQAASSSGSALVPVDVERMRELEGVVANDSSDVEALVELGSLYLGAQRYGEVAQVSMRALALDSTHPGALTNLGMTLVAAGHKPQGKAAFDRALESDPDFHRALLFKGMIAFQDREFDTAVEAWERYLVVAPPEANTARIEGMLQAARQAAGGMAR